MTQLDTTRPKRQLPTIVWIIILPLGLIAFIGGIILLFTALATIEGVASIIMLLAGYFSFRFTRPDNITPAQNIPHSNLFLAGGIVFFALMGIAVDQPGNILYNKPLEYFCPAGSSMNRTVDVLHPLPGRTDMIQSFQCFDSAGNVTNEINIPTLIGVRFLEYILIGYLLYFLSNIRFRKPFQK